MWQRNPHTVFESAFLVRLRPNVSYLALLAVGVLAVGFGIVENGVVRIVLIVCGGLFVFLLGAPVVASTILRVPVRAVDDQGLWLPLMGVRLAWADVARVRPRVCGRVQPVS